jgi:hypothetical protein
MHLLGVPLLTALDCQKQAQPGINAQGEAPFMYAGRQAGNQLSMRVPSGAAACRRFFVAPRPLPAELVMYAVSDVRYLPALAMVMQLKMCRVSDSWLTTATPAPEGLVHRASLGFGGSSSCRCRAVACMCCDPSLVFRGYLHEQHA